MDFSIILLSRKRPRLLRNLLNSIQKTCKTEFEVLAGCDLDDSETQQSKYLFEYQFAKLYFSARNPNLHTYINFLASESKGKYLFVLNDDCLLLNDGWDSIAKARMDAFGEIVYGCTNDDSIDKIGLKDYASFPIVSRPAYNRLGFFMDETFGNHGADVVTYRIYRDAGKICHLPEVRINHGFHCTPDALNARLKDETASQMIQRSLAGGLDINKLLTCDIKDKVNKLCS